jgi:hypothetical protein
VLLFVCLSICLFALVPATDYDEHTSCKELVGGVIKMADSPLVTAARNGYVLVVDEADKAPVHA